MHAQMASLSNLLQGLVIDESHHADCDSVVDMLRAFPDAKVLMVSATPITGDAVDKVSAGRHLSLQLLQPDATAMVLITS